MEEPNNFIAISISPDNKLIASALPSRLFVNLAAPERRDIESVDPVRSITPGRITFKDPDNNYTESVDPKIRCV